MNRPPRTSRWPRKPQAPLKLSDIAEGANRLVPKLAANQPLDMRESLICCYSCMLMWFFWKFEHDAVLRMADKLFKEIEDFAKEKG